MNEWKRALISVIQRHLTLSKYKHVYVHVMLHGLITTQRCNSTHPPPPPLPLPTNSPPPSHSLLLVLLCRWSNKIWLSFLISDTVPIDSPATEFDGSACSKRCRCNPVKNYCGTDPCRCRYTLCSQGETLLQNCTCVRYLMMLHLYCNGGWTIFDLSLEKTFLLISLMNVWVIKVLEDLFNDVL